MPYWYLISDGISKGSVFFALLGGSYLLGASEYGRLVYFSLIISGVGLQFGLRVHVAYEAFFSELSNNERSEYFVGCVCIAVAIAILQYMIGLPFVFFLDSEDLPSMLNWALINIVSFVLYMSQLFQTLFIMHEKQLKYSIVVVVNSILFSISFLYFCYISASGISYLYGYLLAGICTLLTSIFLVHSDFRVSRKGVFIASRRVISFCIRLIPHQLSNFLQGNLDRIMVTIFFTKAELGAYGLAQQVAQVFQLFVIAINKAYYPRGYSLLSSFDPATGMHDFFNLKRRFEFGYICAGLIFAMALPTVFLFLDEEYQAGKLITFLLVLGFLFDALYYTNSVVLFKFERTKTISSISAILLLFYGCTGILIGLYFDSIVFFAVGTFVVFLLQYCAVRLVAYSILREAVAIK